MNQEFARRDFLKVTGVSAASALAPGSKVMKVGEGVAEAAEMPSTHVSKPLISIDLTKPPEEQVIPMHNRWHPDIPPVVSVKPGAVFRVECYDWTGGQIKNDDSANDVRDVELTKVHYLSGPIAVEGAEPGDILVVDILDIGALPTSLWGFTGIFAKTNGGGFLTDHYPDAKKAIWDLQGIYATSRHIKGVRFAGLHIQDLSDALLPRSCLPNGTSGKRNSLQQTPTGFHRWQFLQTPRMRSWEN